MFVTIDPPIVYMPPPGTSPVFRGLIEVDLELILEEAAYAEYILGSTAARVERIRRQEPEILAYGMAIEDRRSIGICAGVGLSALQKVHETNFLGLGRSLRSLQRTASGKAQAQALAMTAHWQRNDWQAVLAAGWRLWHVSTPSGKRKVKAHLGMAFEYLNARLDALALALEDET